MPTRRRVLLASLLLSIAFASMPGSASGRAKTDIVFLGNGDRLTGEIKQLGKGILSLSTDALSTVSIEWDDVDSLRSAYQFRVEDRTGAKYFGPIVLARSGFVEVTQEGGVVRIPKLDAVEMTPLERSFWAQLDGSVSLGFSYTKADQLGQLTFDATARRRTPLRLLELDASSITTSREDEETRTREDLSLTYRRLLVRKFFWSAGGTMERNDELGLDLRTLVALGAGVDMVETNHSLLTVGAGLSGNREWAADESNNGYNVEAIISAEHSVFRYDYPKTDISTEFTIFPSFSDWGRVRSELDISARREVVSDLFVGLSFYNSYDNEPTSEGAEQNDYGLVTSLGWSF